MADRIKGITIKIDGDTTGLSTALKGVNSEIRSTSSQLKDVQRLLKFDPQNAELLRQKQSLLANAIRDTASKLETLREAERQVQEQFRQGNISEAQYNALRREIIETERNLSELEQQATSTTQEIQELENQANRNGLEELEEDARRADSALEDLEQQANSSQSTLQRMREIGSRMQEVGGKITEVGQNLMPVTLAIGGVGVAATKTAADFEASMSNVKEISKASGDDFESLKDKAKEMGEKTKFSASDAADAFGYMAMAGWKTNDMLNGIDGIMNLAAASGEELALTSDIVTDALTGFGLSAKDSGHFADVLASASSNANTNAAMMGESFKYVAPLAGTLGFSAEDVSIALGLMANSGIKGSQAGTSLRSALTNLANPSKTMIQAMREFGIEMFNANGTAKPLAEIMDMLRNKIGSCDQETQAYIASTIFGKQAMSGMLAIVNASEKDYTKLTEAVYNADGAALQMTQTMEDNLNGDIQKLKSTLEAVVISIGEILIPKIREIVAVIKSWVEHFNQLDDKQKEVLVMIALIVASIGPLLIVIGTLVSSIGSIMVAISALSAPILIAIGSIMGLIAIFTALYATNEEFRIKVSEIWNTVVELIRTSIELIKETFTSFIEITKIIWDKFGTDIMNLVQSYFSMISSIIQTVLTFIKDFINVILAIMQGDWERAWEGIKTLFFNLTENIKNIARTWIEYIKNLITINLNFIKSIFDTFRNVIIAIITVLIEKIVESFKTLFSKLEEIANSILNSITKIWNTLKEKAIEIFNNIKEKAIEIFTSMKAGIESKVSEVKDTVVNGIESAVNWIKSLPEQAKTWGRDMIDGFVDGIRSSIQEIKDACEDVASAVSDFLHFTRPETGPLRYYEEWMPHMMQGMAKGIHDNRHLITEQVKGLAIDMSSFLSTKENAEKTSVIHVYNQTVLDGKIIAESVNERLGGSL